VGGEGRERRRGGKKGEWGSFAVSGSLLLIMLLPYLIGAREQEDKKKGREEENRPRERGIVTC